MPVKLTLQLSGTSLTSDDVEDLRDDDTIDVYIASSDYNDESIDNDAQIAITRPELSGESWTITHVDGEVV